MRSTRQPRRRSRPRRRAPRWSRTTGPPGRVGAAAARVSTTAGDGSIWLTQADHAAADVHRVGEAGALDDASASAERTPVLQCSTICLSCGSFSSACAGEELALGDQHRAGDLVDLVLVGLADVDEDEVALAVVALLEHVLELWSTEIVEPAAASAASSETAPQKSS